MLSITRLVLATFCTLTLVAAPPLTAAQDRPAPKTTSAAATTTAFDATIASQVMLDRAGFSVGEIDGRAGANTRIAAAAYRAAKGVRPATGDVPAITNYTIAPEDTAGPFIEKMPTDLDEQAKLPGLFFTSPLEGLGEKFHASPALLKRLNPSAQFVTGEVIRVPNVLLLSEPAPTPAGPVTVTVSKRTSMLDVTDAAGKVIFHAPVTSGSVHDPLPIGKWIVTAVVRNPTFNYNPDLFWDADATQVRAKLPAGPNGPVGVVWIDINKPHYGIHGTAEPGTIGHAESHGCVRLTNWDAMRLAALVKKGTPVVFTP